MKGVRGFVKGHSGNKKGKPKGTLSVKTQAWEKLGDYFTDAGAQRAKEIMMKSSDKEFMVHYQNLIELFKPKLARTETHLSGSVNTTPPVINILPFDPNG